MLESKVKKAVLARLKTVPNCYAYSSPVSRYGQAGVADITAVVNGEALYIECKTPEAHKKPNMGCSAIQMKFSEHVRHAGAMYWVVESLDTLNSLIYEYFGDRPDGTITFPIKSR